MLSADVVTACMKLKSPNMPTSTAVVHMGYVLYELGYEERGELVELWYDNQCSYSVTFTIL